MRSHLLLVVLLSGFFLLPPSATAQQAPRKYALIVGVDHCPNRVFKPLKYAESDSIELEKELKSQGFTTALLTGKGEGQTKATRKNINDQLLKLLKFVHKEDLVLVVLSGHCEFVATNAANGKTRIEIGFCPSDSELGNPTTSLSLSYLNDELLAQWGGRNLIILNTSRENEPEGESSPLLNKLATSRTTTMLVSACGPGERLHESDDLKHGVFAHCLLLNTRKIPAGDNKVDWNNLGTHVQEEMTSETIRKQLIGRQVPVQTGELKLTLPVLNPNNNPLAKLDTEAEFQKGLNLLEGNGVPIQENVATRHLLRAAQQEHPIAMAMIGHCYYLGTGIAEDQGESQRWCKKCFEQVKQLAEAGNREARVEYGWMLASGVGVTESTTEGRRIIQEMAIAGHKRAQTLWGTLNDEGHGGPFNPDEAVRWFRKAADQGYAAAQEKLGDMYDEGRGVAQNHEEAVRWFRKAAEQNCSMGQVKLGQAYRNGTGVEEDVEEAARWYLKAADQDNSLAMFLLGLLHLGGDGVKRDDTLACKYFQRGAELHFAPAMSWLGDMYSQGKGVQQSKEMANVFYLAAAAKGDKKGMFEIGMNCLRGAGIPRDDSRGVLFLQQAANEDYADAQYELGVCYDTGRGIAKSKSEALKWYLKAAVQDDTRAMILAGRLYEDRGDDGDFQSALKLYRRASETGDADGYFFEGVMYRKGRGVPRDPKLAFELIEKAARLNCDSAQSLMINYFVVGSELGPNNDDAITWVWRQALRGDATSQFVFSALFQEGRLLRQDDAMAAEWLAKAEAHDDPDAETAMGHLYEYGGAVKQNYAEAIKWYRKAADKGSDEAQLMLAMTYENGHGVKKNPRMAFELFLKAADNGNSMALYRMGQLAMEGKFVPRNPEKAVEYFREAAKGGEEAAMTALGALYETGIGVPRDDAEAVVWYRKGFLADDPNAAWQLGQRYESGRGVDKDKTKAISYYTEAAKHGHEEAKKALRRLGVKLPK